MSQTALFLGLTAVVFAGVAKAAPPAKRQPIPFSHKLHAKYLPRCKFCHQISVPDGEIVLPSEGKCMQCHDAVAVKSPAIQTLAEHYRDKTPIPWVQIYELPDYVYFSHGRHVTQTKIACATCHGPVAERDVMEREKPISMVACMDCHRSSGAALKCNTCHNANP